MPARWLAALVVLALPAAAAAQVAPPEQTPQELFEQAIVDDAGTTPAIRALLQTDAAFVAPSFADLTGDAKMDAIVQVRIPGAAGTVALYALSTDDTSDGRLRMVFRSQSLYRATVAVSSAALIVTVPRYARGDEVCCPADRERREYAWDPQRNRLRRR
jgi:secreted protein with Ig-like and vWFA domain